MCFGIKTGVQMRVKNGGLLGSKRVQNPRFLEKGRFWGFGDLSFWSAKVLFIFMRSFLENQNPSKSLSNCNSSCERNLRGDCDRDPPCWILSTSRTQHRVDCYRSLELALRRSWAENSTICLWKKLKKWKKRVFWGFWKCALLCTRVCKFVHFLQNRVFCKNTLFCTFFKNKGVLDAIPRRFPREFNRHK